MLMSTGKGQNALEPPVADPAPRNALEPPVADQAPRNVNGLNIN